MIKFFKLYNGEEVVAEVEDSGEWCEQLELHKPYRNVMTDHGMMLIPYPCDTISVFTHHILFTGKARADLIASYQECTGGIVTPPMKLQIPH
jgi:hypothetical protein